MVSSDPLVIRTFTCNSCDKTTSIKSTALRLAWKKPRILCGSCGSTIYVNSKTEVKQRPDAGSQPETNNKMKAGVISVQGTITSALGSSNGIGQPIKITKEYLEHESIQLYMEDKSTASFRNLLEVFKICYNSKNEKEIDLDLEDFELVGKQVRANGGIKTYFFR